HTIERGDDRFGLPTDGYRPYELIGVAEILGHEDTKDILVPPCVEMCRLPAISGPRLELVIGANRDVEFFFEVAVHVAEPHVEGAVVVDVETFVDRCQSLSGPVPQLLDLGTGSARQQQHTDQR